MRDGYLKTLINEKFFRKYLTFEYDNEIVKPVIKQYKISICTTCMNRLEDIKKTFEQNMIDNLDYPKLEFVLLNYNSQDDLDDYVKNDLKKYIDNGLLNYYKTIEPKYYSMTHSRNVVFKLAQGDIVNNVDADQFTNKGFASKINELANQKHEKTVFVKSRQKNRGRVGFFKKDFLELGGYNEEIEGYGFDDEDLVARAYHSGFTLMKFGGEFMRIVEDHKRHIIANYKNPDWKYTQRRNTVISLLNLMYKKYVANEGKEWGKAILIKNFSENVEV